MCLHDRTIGCEPALEMRLHRKVIDARGRGPLVGIPHGLSVQVIQKVGGGLGQFRAFLSREDEGLAAAINLLPIGPAQAKVNR